MDLMEHLLEKDVVKEMGNHVMMHDLNNDVAILNSLANYTYTHQLLKCKAF